MKEKPAWECGKVSAPLKRQSYVTDEVLSSCLPASGHTRCWSFNSHLANTSALAGRILALTSLHYKTTPTAAPLDSLSCVKNRCLPP